MHTTLRAGSRYRVTALVCIQRIRERKLLGEHCQKMCSDPEFPDPECAPSETGQENCSRNIAKKCALTPQKMCSDPEFPNAQVVSVYAR